MPSGIKMMLHVLLSLPSILFHREKLVVNILNYTTRDSSWQYLNFWWWLPIHGYTHFYTAHPPYIILTLKYFELHHITIFQGPITIAYQQSEHLSMVTTNSQPYTNNQPLKSRHFSNDGTLGSPKDIWISMEVSLWLSNTCLDICRVYMNIS